MEHLLVTVADKAVPFAENGSLTDTALSQRNPAFIMKMIKCQAAALGSKDRSLTGHQEKEHCGFCSCRWLRGYPPNSNSSWGSEGSAKIFTTRGGVVPSTKTPWPALFLVLSFPQELPHEDVHVAGDALSPVAKCLLNQVQPEITFPRHTPMFHVHTSPLHTHTCVPPMQFNWRPDSPCNPLCQAVCPSQGFHGQLGRWPHTSWWRGAAGEHTLPRTPLVQAQRRPWVLPGQRGSEGRAAMCMQPISLLPGI